jgi:ATP-binding cassette subfamily F protein 3
MLTIRELKMTFGGRVLFEDASFAVNYGDRVALVGPNGAGKTTLFSIILKQLEPDAGAVLRDEWTMVGHLPQEAEAQGDETILDVATGRVDELPHLEKRLHELEKSGDVSSPE